MDENPRSSAIRRVLVSLLVAAIVATALSLVSSSTASAAAPGGVAVSSASKLGACKKRAVSACRKVTARACRVKTAKRARARGLAVSKRKIARGCARKAKRHCAKRAQKRRQAAKARRCARPRGGAVRGAALPSGVLPGASNTGVPPGTRLKVVRGDMTITRDGTTLSGLDIRGFVKIRANNVTIRNTIIRGRTLSGNESGTLLANWDGNTGLVVSDSSLIGTQAHKGLGGFKGRNASLNRVEIAKVIDQVQAIGGNLSITNSWLHSNLHLPDAGYSDGVSHDDNIQIEGGSNIDILNNRIEGSYNAAVMVTQNYARAADIRISDSYLSGGGCTINISEKGKGSISPMSVTGNRFGPARVANCAVIAPDTSRPTMSGNTWASNGSAVSVRRGA